jgi:hypothetical protein
MRRLQGRLANLDRQMREVLQQEAAFDSTSAKKYLQRKIDQIRYRLVILSDFAVQAIDAEGTP